MISVCFYTDETLEDLVVKVQVPRVPLAHELILLDRQRYAVQQVITDLDAKIVKVIVRPINDRRQGNIGDSWSI